MWRSRRALILVPLIAGCATLSESECQYADWGALGEADGLNGATVERFQTYSSACSRYGIRADFTAWDAGRERGLEQFCTPQGVYSAGLRLLGNTGECGFDPELNRIHRVTINFARARVELERVRSDYEALLFSYDRSRRLVRDMRRKLQRSDLGKKERERAERALRNARDDLDRFPWEQQQVLFRINDLERALTRAELGLLELEREFGLAGDRFAPLL